MGKTVLNGTWEVTYLNEKLSITVPSVLEKYLDKRDLETEFYFKRSFHMNIKPNHHYILNCEGISYAAEVFINDIQVGVLEGIWTTHQLRIEQALKDGENTIFLRIHKPSFDKTSPYYFRSILFGFIPDVLFPFSGIYKDIYIEEKQINAFKDCRIYFDYEQKEVVINSSLYSNNEEKNQLIIEIVKGNKICLPYEKEIRLKIENLKEWNPDNPYLYNIKVTLLHHGEFVDEKEARIGYRSIQIKDDKVLLNGKESFFRAILHWGYYPEDFMIVPDKETVRKELIAIKEQGFNAVKFCLFIPPSYYYELCDELGILVWQELPLWLPYDNGYLFDRINRQYPKMMYLCANHPSLYMISIGCELDQTIPANVLNDLYKMITNLHTQAIVCDNSGSGECYDGAVEAESDIYDYHFYGEIHNMQKLINEFKHCSRKKKPWFFGEFNDMDTFRDLIEVKKNSTYELYWANEDKEKNLLRYVHANAVSDMPIYHYEKIISESLKNQNMQQLRKSANQKAYDVRKYNLETTRKNNINGYSITAIRDVPITSCGIFDDFQQKKWSDEAMRSINGDIVISMSAPLRRKWNHGADVFESYDEYNFYEETMISNRIQISNQSNFGGEIEIKISLQAETFKIEDTEKTILKPYTSSEVFSLALNLPKVYETQLADLRIEVKNKAGILTSNHWNIWVYPKNHMQIQLFDPCNYLDGVEECMDVVRIKNFKEVKRNVLVTTVLNDEILEVLPKNISIVYLQNGEGYFPIQREPFWRECVHLIKENTFLNVLKTKGYDSLQFISAASDVTIHPQDIYTISKDYTSFMYRIDNRRFHRSECIFSIDKDGHDILVCTLNLGKGTGSQARSFVENVFSQNLLVAMIKRQEDMYDRSETNI